MTTIDLDAIAYRAREVAKFAGDRLTLTLAQDDVPALLGKVRDLRAQLVVRRKHQRGTVTVDVSNLDAVTSAMQELAAERDAYRAVVDAARAWRTAGIVSVGRSAGVALGAIPEAHDRLREAIDALPAEEPS